MVDEAAMVRLVEWCKRERSEAQSSLKLMEEGTLKLFHGAAHTPPNDVTPDAIRRAKKTIEEMDAIINAEERRRAAH